VNSKRYAEAAEHELMKQPETFWLKNRFAVTNQALISAKLFNPLLKKSKTRLSLSTYKIMYVPEAC
jgi:hypothetical protein